MAIEEEFSDSRALADAEQYRRRKTTSVLAIVFSDIANSTALREQLGEIRYEALREEYDGEFAKIIQRDDAGAVVKSTGDGALAVFSEPSVAVEHCIQVQMELGKHPQFKLRIGVDMGQVTVKASQGIVRDIFGRHVNRAARIESLAEPGHILTSFNIFDCAVGWLRDTDIRWHNHGVTELKGFDDPVSIHEAYEMSGLPPISRTLCLAHIAPFECDRTDLADC
jgi:class 3 adenylate cyclase